MGVGIVEGMKLVGNLDISVGIRVGQNYCCLNLKDNLDSCGYLSDSEFVGNRDS